MSPHEVLTFWFGGAALDHRPDEAASARWFSGGDAFDVEVRERFGALLERPDEVTSWASSPAGALAAIIVFDQLPRNIFRGTSRAFAFDLRARELARECVDRGLDRGYGDAQRRFVYLPLMHAEDLEIQRESVARYRAMLDAASPGTPAFAAAENTLRYAVKHMEIVERFGRFPGRNRALSRDDTPEELAWFAEGGESFGQR